MEPLELKYKPILTKDKSGKPRWMVVLQDGRRTLQTRWMMMNFLHTNHIPTRLDVHHINGISDDDRIENFQLKEHGTHISEHLKGTGKFGIVKYENRLEYNRLWAAERDSDPERKATAALRKKESNIKHAVKRKQYRTKHREENHEELLIKESARRKKLSEEDPLWKEKNRAWQKAWRVRTKADPEAKEKKRLSDQMYMKAYRIRKKEEQDALS
ncbi:MAG: hypothetical protein WC373_15405 [Smithella sp.]|jgi:HD superfamily phosphohydrolase